MHALDYYSEVPYQPYGYMNYCPPRINYEHKCKYAFKSCPNTRSAKKNGEMHKLCEYHRRKANNVQKFYARRKRHAKSLEQGKSQPQTPASDSDSGDDVKSPWANMTLEPLPFYATNCSKADPLAYEDCLMLIKILT
ncbi:hypothetical protein SPRG_10341 [Saprolegnia parasitica CBS 223.65]|uniref:Uncharacterized protein n=1 Tax=Saprolegnia parasitica (strain CBS 223.65) TaxID=695850 RepID=A0A067CD92_SAPPC|nr:hypothetical protein SPRG_10341 [Saprolegnia parasitica CBS 223.65]KDO24526.1 hypothetical protein SPRG_10341 [Saprolegnia parasitica CBS 223.65]|eukprot:XP_012204788.1 hypothetical protein SPRG_10341 [Saprolegnia parasitica CBS 223.65]